MTNFDGRHVCVSDLINYLKKDDYLSGYTEAEQEQIRQNIGAAGKDDLLETIDRISNLYIDGTYEEIKVLADQGELKTGYRYAITDFQSIYLSNSNEIKISPVTYTIILNAIDAYTFDRRVFVLSDDYPNSYKWIVEYDFTQQFIQGTKDKGRIVYLKDQNNNVAYYDFKGIQFRRTKSELQKLGITIQESYKDLFTFSSADFTEASENYNIYNNYFDANCTNNIFIGNNIYNNTFKGGFKNNTFTSVCQNSTFDFDSQNNNFTDPVMYLNGQVSNKDFIGLNYTSNNITKTIHKVDEGYVLVYLDDDTLTNQIIKL